MGKRFLLLIIAVRLLTYLEFPQLEVGSVLGSHTERAEKVASVSGSLVVDNNIEPSSSYFVASKVTPEILERLRPKATKEINWGQAEKIGEHLYRVQVGQDSSMASPAEILDALNSYRSAQGRNELRSDDKLCAFASSRAQEQDRRGSLDSHAGFKSYLDDPKHWEELGVTGIGENSSWGYVLSGTHIIEWVFNASPEHRANQLNPDWTLACAGVAGKTVNVIFGKR